jgi:hypothetical protein
LHGEEVQGFDALFIQAESLIEKPEDKGKQAGQKNRRAMDEKELKDSYREWEA